MTRKEQEQVIESAGHNADEIIKDVQFYTKAVRLLMKIARRKVA